MTTPATRNVQESMTEGTLFVAFELRGCPETSQPRCEAFKPRADDIGKLDKIAVKACSA
jgi:hypothetical protein